MPSAAEALPGRATEVPVADAHFVNGAPLQGPFPGLERAIFAMGCFWGAERRFWQAQGVHSTAVGYVNGSTPNPTYQEVCSGRTGHTEAVQVIFDPSQTSYAEMLALFWQEHDPTQGMRQGNDSGTQYRSGIYFISDAQGALASASRDLFQEVLQKARLGTITTEIVPAPEFFYAEDYHQQYLAKNPQGYCGIGGSGARLPEDWLSRVPA
jgi:peptide-methionine (S)-S-oxide reductase